MCRDCKAGPAQCEVLTYAGCKDCRPEAKLRQKVVRADPAAGILMKAAIAISALCGGVDARANSQANVTSAVSAPSVAAILPPHQSVYHVAENPRAIEHMIDCEVPTEFY